MVFVLMKLESVDFVLGLPFVHLFLKAFIHSFTRSFRRWCICICSSNSMEVFNQFHPIPYTKMLTFYRSEPFQLEAAYNSTDSALLNPEIGLIFFLCFEAHSSTVLRFFYFSAFNFGICKNIVYIMQLFYVEEKVKIILEFELQVSFR